MHECDRRQTKEHAMENCICANIGGMACARCARAIPPRRHWNWYWIESNRVPIILRCTTDLLLLLLLPIPLLLLVVVV